MLKINRRILHKEDEVLPALGSSLHVSSQTGEYGTHPPQERSFEHHKYFCPEIKITIDVTTFLVWIFISIAHTYRAMSSKTMILSFENVKQLRMFAALVVGIAIIFCRIKVRLYS